MKEIVDNPAENISVKIHQTKQVLPFEKCDVFCVLEVTTPKLPKRKPVDVLFIIDCSSSMSSILHLVKSSTDALINKGLEEGDTFYLATFADTVTRCTKDQFLPVTDQNKKAVEDILRSIDARGDTNYGQAIHHAEEVVKKRIESLQNDEMRNIAVIFFTDGQPTVGPLGLELEELLLKVERFNPVICSWFCVGYGSSYKLEMLKKTAHIGHRAIIPGPLNSSDLLRCFHIPQYGANKENQEITYIAETMSKLIWFFGSPQYIDVVVYFDCLVGCRLVKVMDSYGEVRNVYSRKCGWDVAYKGFSIHLGNLREDFTLQIPIVLTLAEETKGSIANYYVGYYVPCSAIPSSLKTSELEIIRGEKEVVDVEANKLYDNAICNSIQQYIGRQYWNVLNNVSLHKWEYKQFVELQFLIYNSLIKQFYVYDEKKSSEVMASEEFKELNNLLMSFGSYDRLDFCESDFHLIQWARSSMYHLPIMLGSIQKCIGVVFEVEQRTREVVQLAKKQRGKYRYN